MPSSPATSRTLRRLSSTSCAARCRNSSGYLLRRPTRALPPWLVPSLEVFSRRGSLHTLATAQVLLGVHSEARWLRLVPAALPGAFPYLPGQSSYKKRLRAALPLLKRLIWVLAADTDLWTDPVWLVDSTPVECARSRPTVVRSDLAGIAGYSYCPGHSRWFWGLRLHLICTPAGLSIRWALADPELDERQVPMCVLDADADLLAERPGLLLLADKGLRLRRTRRLPARPRRRP